ncbi:hypothetical protein [uncultured Roseibium sp.]|uniref:hypothetical protein n=1 Tax=uncultured Roseibium sp. TaxID=1936171 RepID=UPI002599CDCB|nr:hypothetical protein [uncultured Roseibium sp.]
MPRYSLSLTRHNSDTADVHEISSGHHAIYVLKGSLSISGVSLETSTGLHLQNPTQIKTNNSPAQWLCFRLADEVPYERLDGELRLCEVVELESTAHLLRLDTVSFPMGACAWRHVHPGPGIRYLAKGRLKLQSDDHEQLMEIGDSWFEAAQSPVRATADAKMPETLFVRVMILPTKFEGRPTINILDAEDRLRPRLQTTKRIIDAVISLQDG